MKKFREQYKTGLEHFDAANESGKTWICNCAECARLRNWREARAAREKARTADRDLLIKIMTLRQYPNQAAELARAQVEFERLMIKKLKLTELSCAAWYGLKPARLGKAVAA